MSDKTICNFQIAMEHKLNVITQSEIIESKNGFVEKIIWAICLSEERE